ncbi:hypothetical protein SDC9_90284 [bioreactor metagenome]|uniref:Uncharacterized protein n=1 Tax=bioreactor metagenome TaxID=1076179 RepID=A0A644ZS75_9ZZZZ
MGDDRQISFSDGFQYRRKPFRVVVMAMGDHDGVRLMERNLKLVDVVQKSVGVLPHIDEYSPDMAFPLRLKPERNPVLGKQGAFIRDTVLRKYRDFQ